MQSVLTRFRTIQVALLILPAILGITLGAQQPSNGAKRPSVGPGSVIVQSQFGGQIFGFDIDSNGAEGVLCEAAFLPTGKLLAAVETFDQATGKILKVVKRVQWKDDFITLGVVGGIGVVEREHVKGIFVDSRIYSLINPLSGNKVTGEWTPGLTKDDIILSLRGYPGSSRAAVLGFENSGNSDTFVMGTNIAKNKVQQRITLTDPTFFFANGPAVAYDPVKNRAIVAAADGALGGPPPVIAIVNLGNGIVNEFLGVPGPPPFRQGFINGMALDAEDGIVVTTTEVDFRVEFYDLKTKAGFAMELPGATGQLQSGSDVAYDPINKLFLVAQSVSSTGPGSSIHVYDIHGNLVESLDGFNFSNASKVIRTHIALNPANRTGYVDGPDPGVTQLQSFSY